MAKEDLNTEGLVPSSHTEIDFSSMTDEEVLNMPFPSFEAPEMDDDEDEEDEITEDVVTDPEDDPEEEDDDPFEELDDADEEDDPIESDEDDPEDLEAESEDTPEDDDYKSKYEALLAPFRANGKEVKVDTPEDLRRLAQMGVGFNARMAELKPIRKIAKMLENEGLLSEDKINFLIDLSKKDVSAINKLVKESGINPLDIDTEGTDGYKPNTYTVNDNQLELDEALDDLERTSSGQRVIDLVSNKWDSSSKQVLVSNPNYLRQLQDQVDSGIYDQVIANVERERLLGRIPSSVSDLDAYNYVGNQMAQAGAFNKPATTPTGKNTQRNKAEEDTKRNKRKRAAASPKGKKPASKPIQTNILSMSDEEFEKTLMSKYM